ncbi:hypothetical protein EMEDMD4_1310102 [Sinorhizobium medicae]|uniref:Uncharacterized protein n=1 Tax=Sinorhizobium medicae TaxID=110321 RepID=A0A508WRG1_9HYPH|nr:hypothetical protein EMEDMD4_1310102 [Sinorhizobium medicae]
MSSNRRATQPSGVGWQAIRRGYLL